MTDEPSDPINIGPAQRRLRFWMGIVSLGVGGISAILLLTFHLNPYWRLILFLPFWAGSLGILQHRDGI